MQEVFLCLIPLGQPRGSETSPPLWLVAFALLPFHYICQAPSGYRCPIYIFAEQTIPMSNSYKCKEKDFTEMMDNVDAFGFWQTTGISRSGSSGLVLHLGCEGENNKRVIRLP